MCVCVCVCVCGLLFLCILLLLNHNIEYTIYYTFMSVRNLMLMKPTCSLSTVYSESVHVHHASSCVTCQHLVVSVVTHNGM